MKALLKGQRFQSAEEMKEWLQVSTSGYPGKGMQQFFPQWQSGCHKRLTVEGNYFE
jgi:hypothetical protein